MSYAERPSICSSICGVSMPRLFSVLAGHSANGGAAFAASVALLDHAGVDSLSAGNVALCTVGATGLHVPIEGGVFAALASLFGGAFARENALGAVTLRASSGEHEWQGANGSSTAAGR